MIKDEQKRILIEYRIELAKATINEAKILLDNDMYRAAINRIYYGIKS